MTQPWEQLSAESRRNMDVRIAMLREAGKTEIDSYISRCRHAAAIRGNCWRCGDRIRFIFQGDEGECKTCREELAKQKNG